MDKKIRIAVIFLLASIAITSCNGTGIFDVSAGMRAPNPVTGLGHTETPTPFLPLSPTGTIYVSEGTASVPTPAITPTPTLTDPWGDFPGPTRESAIAIDPPVQQIDAGGVAPAVPVALDLYNVKEVIPPPPEYGPVRIEGMTEALRRHKVIPGPVTVLLVFGTKLSCRPNEFL